MVIFHSYVSLPEGNSFLGRAPLSKSRRQSMQWPSDIPPEALTSLSLGRRMGFHHCDFLLMVKLTQRVIQD